MIDAATIRLRFPGVFDAPGVSDASLNGAIVAATQQINPVAFGVLADEATLYLACHIAETTKIGRAGGLQRAEAGFVKMDYGPGGGQYGSSFMALYKDLLKRTVCPVGLA